MLLILLLTLSSSLQLATCTIDLYLNPYGTTIYLIDSQTRSWNESNVFCQGISGSLPVIKNDFESVDLGSSLPPSTASWLGIKESGRRSRIFYENNNSSIHFSKWDRGQPDGDCPDGCCVFISNNGFWGDYDCSLTLPTTCQIEITNTTSDTIKALNGTNHFSRHASSLLYGMNIRNDLDEHRRTIVTTDSGSVDVPKMINTKTQEFDARFNDLSNRVDTLNAMIDGIKSSNRTDFNSIGMVHVEYLSDQLKELKVEIGKRIENEENSRKFSVTTISILLLSISIFLFFIYFRIKFKHIQTENNKFQLSQLRNNSIES